MIRAKYLGDVPNFQAFGIDFPADQFVDITDAKIAAKLKANSHYAIKEGDFEDVEFTEKPVPTVATAPEPAPARRGRRSNS